MTGATDQSVALYIGRVLMLAIAYAVAGRLALLLAIPPGYATAVWPAAGIALAAVMMYGYRVWPGLVLGSFLVNVSTGFDSSSSEAVLKSLSIAGCIGIGAALQGTIGGWLVRRFAGYPNAMLQPREIISFLMHGGPVGCLVAATWGVSTLVVFGVLPAERAAYSWFTWWVGDTIGVLIFAPLVLLWLSRDSRYDRARAGWITLALAFTFTLATIAYIIASGWENHRIRNEFQKAAANDHHHLETVLQSYLTAMDFVNGFGASTEGMTAVQFERFCKPAMERHPGLYALSWNTLVPQEDRPAFERFMQEQGFAEFQIREQDSRGQWIVAGERPEYAVVTYIEPFESNRQVQGFDLLSQPTRRLAVETARQSLQPVVTRRIRLVQETADQFGVLILHPVAHSNGSGDALHPRVIGFATGVLRLSDVIASSLPKLQDGSYDLRIYDRSAPPAEQLLYANQPGVSRTDPPPQVSARDFALVSSITFADRQWEFHTFATTAYLASIRSWESWAVLVAGLLFTGILGAFLLVLNGRTILEADRSLQLAHANADLRKAMMALERTDEALKLSNEQLTARNAEMEQFVYTVSHDLKSPLVTIRGFTGLLRQDMAAGAHQEAADSIRQIDGAAARMLDLISDLLQFSRVGRVHHDPERIDLRELLEKMAATLIRSSGQTGVEVFVQPDLPVLLADRTRIIQVFENLLTNALKYGCDSTGGKIEVRSWQDDATLHLTVRDYGPGIPEAYQEKIFGLFQRLVHDNRGTGVGLAIVRRVVHHFGGTVTVQSPEGGGAMFQVTLPAGMLHPQGEGERPLHPARTHESASA